MGFFAGSWVSFGGAAFVQASPAHPAWCVQGQGIWRELSWGLPLRGERDQALQGSGAPGFCLLSVFKLN